jgi:cytochrome c5
MPRIFSILLIFFPIYLYAESNAKNIYEQHCIICHRDGVAGAPKYRDGASWKARIGQRDIDALVVSAIKGKNAMPPKGTCQECTDSDIKAAIEYMVPQK